MFLVINGIFPFWTFYDFWYSRMCYNTNKLGDVEGGNYFKYFITN